MEDADMLHIIIDITKEAHIQSGVMLKIERTLQMLMM